MWKGWIGFIFFFPVGLHAGETYPPCEECWLSSDNRTSGMSTIVETGGRLLVVWQDCDSNKLIGRRCDQGRKMVRAL
ncbi:putative alpha-rhamnosidase-like protein [Chlamydia abortus]|nr:alpha-rhamnosidase-like protein [Chlamydia abortus]SFV97341.1 putative alpha-rhamnosidase-like protein [Chlamydia abortus]SFV99310.1 putative alpha-rhamnosidase-like protein [Chlamydia abortus]SFW01676.1 putative alpha-rhamnosidase-like protein [Chlamydia abortus]SFW03025.1 putative alpha-rhamnosidase-like protein [Chlamydia abortus]